MESWVPHPLERLRGGELPVKIWQVQVACIALVGLVLFSFFECIWHTWPHG